MDKTGWISGDLKPVRDGVYERNYKGSQGQRHAWFCKYERGLWHIGEHTIDRASKTTETSVFEFLPWRGLANDPNK